VELGLNQLRELLSALDQTDVTELCLKGSDFELTIRRGGNRPEGNGSQNIVSLVPPAASKPELTLVNRDVPQATPPPPAVEKNWVDVTSPMVGTFYQAPAPDEPAFVTVGDRITKGQTLCIIEAMKLMNEIEAEVAGEVVEILIENGQPVEYGQPLMRVKPAGS